MQSQFAKICQIQSKHVGVFLSSEKSSDFQIRLWNKFWIFALYKFLRGTYLLFRYICNISTKSKCEKINLPLADISVIFFHASRASCVRRCCDTRNQLKIIFRTNYLQNFHENVTDELPFLDVEFCWFLPCFDVFTFHDFLSMFFNES